MSAAALTTWTPSGRGEISRRALRRLVRVRPDVRHVGCAHARDFRSRDTIDHAAAEVERRPAAPESVQVYMGVA